MNIRVESTTDAPEVVQAALGEKSEKVVETKAEAKAEAKSVAEETQAESVDESETSKDESSDSTDESEKEIDGKPKKSGFEKRISKLTKQKAKAQSEADYWRNEALKYQNQKTEAPKAETKKETQGRPKADDFENHDDYIEAVAEWKADQKIAEREQKEKEAKIKADFDSRLAKHEERLKAFVKAHGDFDDVIAEIGDEVVPVTIQQIILDSENGPELMYELAKDKDEYKRISSLNPTAAAKELGKLEAKIEARRDSSEKPTEKKTTRAPAPLKPVSGAGKAQAKSIYDPDISQEEFERLRAEQLKRKRA